jgi:hypothetical protein
MLWRPGAGAVVHGGADALADQLDALGGQRVGVHGRVHRDVGLDVVDEGVHAARGGDVRRAAVGEHGVDQRDVRDQVRADDALLHVELLVGEDGDRGDLGAGAGRGRDGDQRQALLGDLIDADVVLELVVVGGEDRDDLGDVDRRAAAEADDEVVAALLGEVDDLVHAVHGRLRHGVVVDADLETGVDQRPLDVVDGAAAGDAGVGEDQDLAGAELLGLGADLGDAAVARDERLGRPVDADLGIHGSSSPWWRGGGAGGRPRRPRPPPPGSDRGTLGRRSR